ncbi:MAG: fasciclin domain-containing protein, partial [Halieaceae bacterium]|nr:fasciclin domain-containing protein [Halieaceae bacterium]
MSDEMSDDGMTDEMSMAPSGPGCAAVPTDGDGSFAGMADDPAATAASNNPVLSTLVSAVTEAGLVDTLNGDGPFTIFAPTNDAFAAIPADQLDAVLADTDLLTSILTYHVIAGESLDAAGLGEQGTAMTVNGEELTFGDDGTTVNGADVICSNVPTANATVHIIDAVLLPDTAMDALGAMSDDMTDDMTDDDMTD